MVISKLIDDYVLQIIYLPGLCKPAVEPRMFFFIFLGYSQIILTVYGGIQKHSKILCRNKMQTKYITPYTFQKLLC